jgi:cobalt-zinc-cadmium efflux system outer membrane protein
MAENVLDFNNAWKRIVCYSPELETIHLEVEMKRAERWQAGLIPNPILSVEWDSFGGSGDYRGFKGSSGSFSISQMFELGGKRARRVLVADANIETAESLEQVVKIDLLAGLTISMLELAGLQNKLQIKEKLLLLAEESYSGFSSKVDNGKASLLAKRRSGVEKATRRLEVETLRNEENRAKFALCKRWGAEEPDFQTIDFALYSLCEPPPFDELCDLLSNNPIIQKWDNELSSYSEGVCLERANSIPNLEVSTGLNSDYGCANNAFFLEFSFAIPLFDRNQANIRRAELALCQKEWQRQDDLLKIQHALRRTWEEWNQSYRKAKIFQDEIIPSVEESVKMTEEGHAQGKFEYQEVIDAKKDWLEAQALFIDTLVEMHRYKIETQRLIGME